MTSIRPDKAEIAAELRAKLASQLRPDGVALLDELLAAVVNPVAEIQGVIEQRYWLESVLDRLPIGLALIDPKDGKVRFANDAMADIVGVPIVGTGPDERHDGTDVQAIHPSGRPLTSDEIPSMRAARGEVLDQEHVQLRSPKGMFDLAASTDMIPESHGHEATAILLLQDVTQVKRFEAALQASEARYRLATLATREAIWDWDLTTDEVKWNEALHTELGHDLSGCESTGKWWYAHIHPDDAARVVAGIHAVIDGKTNRWSDEYRFLCGDGSFAVVKDRGHIVRDASGKGVRMIGAMQDVTREQEAAVQLQRSEAEFRQLAEAIPQMLFVADLQGNITYYNQRWYDYVGLEPGQTEAWRWQQHPIHHPDDLERTIEVWKKALATGEPYQIEYRLRRHDGAYRWHLGRALLIRDADGQPLKWLGTNTDIHEQRFLAEQLSMAVSAASLGFWEWRIGESRCYWSEHLRIHYGFPVGQMSGTLQEVFDRIHPEDRERVQAALDAAMARRARYHLEFRVMPDDKTVRWLECQGDCHFDSVDQAVRMTGTSLDVTSRKLAAQQLEAAKEVAESASRLKSAFLANMSHEIRTPLAAVLGYSELLRDRSLTEAEHESYIEVISRAGASLTSIIDDILDLSKVEAGKLMTAAVPTNVRETLAEVMELFKKQAAEKGIGLVASVTADVPTAIVSDPHRLRQILVNLVGNAVKFTDLGSVEIDVTMNAHGTLAAPTVLFAITDTGIGVRPSERSRLFQPFTQADESTTRRHGGTGLGLALSRRLARALGGDVWLADHDGVGAKFMFCVRADLSDGAPLVATPDTQTMTPTLAGVRVLLAEDAPDNQLLVSRVLTRHGASVAVAGNGEDAVSMALTDQFDVVLMDIQMPLLDGYSATKTLRAAGYAKPIIALTAHAMLEEQQKTREAGCDAHLTKPMDFGALIASVGRFARRETTT